MEFLSGVDVEFCYMLFSVSVEIILWFFLFFFLSKYGELHELIFEC